MANSRSTFFKNRNLFLPVLSEFFGVARDPDIAPTVGELMRSAPAEELDLYDRHVLVPCSFYECVLSEKNSCGSAILLYQKFTN